MNMEGKTFSSVGWLLKKTVGGSEECCASLLLGNKGPEEVGIRSNRQYSTGVTFSFL